MSNYHIFKMADIPVLFLTEYKQAFIIFEEEYSCIKNDMSLRGSIIEKYISKVTSQDCIEKKQGKDYIYELYLCVANDCNACCSYCFANQGNYGKKVGLMKKDIAQKAIDFFFQRVPEECLAVITFFGGEPLLAYDIIVEMCDYIKMVYRDRKYEFHITTNGTLLSREKIDFLVDNDFRIAISIDGGRTIQNAQRPLKNGKDSYAETTKNIGYLIEKQARLLARGTYVNFDCDLSKCYADLLDIGFEEVNIVPDLMDIKNKEQMDKFISQLEGVYKYILEYIRLYDDFPFGLFKRQIRQLFLPQSHKMGSCGAGKTTYAVDINGDIFPCHRYSGVAESVMGNVLENTFEEGKIEEKSGNDSCRECWNRNTCSHGCHYENRVVNSQYKTVNPYYCMYAKKMTELVICLCMNMDELQLLNLMKARRIQGNLI